MPTSAPGSSRRSRRPHGFTLIEVVVVMAIVAIAAGLITFSVRDPAQTRLEREAVRLAALLETARTEARNGGFDVAWVPGTDAEGHAFTFAGLPRALALPRRWLDDRVVAEVVNGKSLVLGPDAILPPQQVVLRLDDRQIVVGSDGLGAFAITSPAP